MRRRHSLSIDPAQAIQDRASDITSAFETNSSFVPRGWRAFEIAHLETSALRSSRRESHGQYEHRGAPPPQTRSKKFAGLLWTSRVTLPRNSAECGWRVLDRST